MLVILLHMVGYRNAMPFIFLREANRFLFIFCSYAKCMVASFFHFPSLFAHLLDSVGSYVLLL